MASISSAKDRRRTSISDPRGTIKFPDFDPRISKNLPVFEDGNTTIPSSPIQRAGRISLDERPRPRSNGNTESRWQPVVRHTKQKSLSEAIRTVRTRKGSVSQNAVEIAEALKPPISIKLVVS